MAFRCFEIRRELNLFTCLALTLSSVLPVPNVKQEAYVKSKTPLSNFLNAMDRGTRLVCAEICGTKMNYLQQLAGQERPNPNLRLAFALVAESKRLSGQLNHPSLTLEDLLVGAVERDPMKQKPGRKLKLKPIVQQDPSIG